MRQKHVISEDYEVFYSYVGPEGYWLRASRVVEVRGSITHPSEAKSWHDQAAAEVLKDFKRGQCRIDKVVYQ